MKEKTEAVVLDQFGEPWGIVDTDRPSGAAIEVFSEHLIGGAPINTKTRRISRTKENLDWFKNHQEAGCVEFTEYIFGGYTFYKY